MSLLVNRAVCVPLESVRPYHPPRRWDQLEALITSMREFGWKGRPIVVADTQDGFVAFTGSHRLAAAKDAGVPSIPIIVMTPDEFHVAREAGVFQDDRMEALLAEGYRAIGELMYMDSLIPMMLGQDAAEYPWDKDALEFYRRQGVLKEVIDVMAIQDWC